jgi:hypothetical protein
MRQQGGNMHLEGMGRRAPSAARADEETAA